MKTKRLELPDDDEVIIASIDQEEGETPNVHIRMVDEDDDEPDTTICVAESREELQKLIATLQQLDETWAAWDRGESVPNEEEDDDEEKEEEEEEEEEPSGGGGEGAGALS